MPVDEFADKLNLADWVYDGNGDCNHFYHELGALTLQLHGEDISAKLVKQDFWDYLAVVGRAASKALVRYHAWIIQERIRGTIAHYEMQDPVITIQEPVERAYDTTETTFAFPSLGGILQIEVTEYRRRGLLYFVKLNDDDLFLL